jgi:hypothetical protein
MPRIVAKESGCVYSVVRYLASSVRPYRSRYHRVWFLADPRTRKWITQCSACGQYGRRSDAPTNIPKVRFEEMFPIQDIDTAGLCENWAKYEGLIAEYPNEGRQPANCGLSAGRNRRLFPDIRAARKLSTQLSTAVP